MQDTFPISQKKAVETFVDKQTFTNHVSNVLIHGGGGDGTTVVNQTVYDNLPVGSISWFNLTEAPIGWVICNGKWYSSDGITSSTSRTETCIIETPNLIGKYPLGSTTNIGDAVDAGLPNITGFAGYSYGDTTHDINVSGAFIKGDPVDAHTLTGVYTDPNTYGAINFDASESNEVYGNSNTVTPPSVNLLPCMKIQNIGNAKLMSPPDYNNVTSITTFPYTFPADGWCSMYIDAANNGRVVGAACVINDTIVAYAARSGTDWNNSSVSMVPVSKDDILTVAGSFGEYDMRFIPCVNNAQKEILQDHINDTERHLTANDRNMLYASAGYYDWTLAETLRVWVSNVVQEILWGTETVNYIISDKITNQTHPGIVAEGSHLTSTFVNITFKTRGLINYSATSYPIVISRDGGVSWNKIYAGGASGGDAVIGSLAIDVLPGDQVMFVVGSSNSQPWNVTYVPWKYMQTTDDIPDQDVNNTTSRYSDIVELFNSTGSNVGSNTRYLRVHSDGYKEMWGVITIHSSTSNVVVELPDSFSDVNYNISQINSGTYGAFSCGNLENNSFTLTHAQYMTTNFVIRWKATGY